jgi:LCP family protein required for cell wall assembly
MSKNKKKENKNILGRFIYILFLIISTLFIGIIFYLKILPSKYFMILFVIYFILNLIFILLSFNKHLKKRTHIVVGTLCFILSAIFLFGLYYLNTTMNFMSKIMANNYQLENYYVYVLSDSDYKSINDLEDKTIGIPKISNDTYEEAYSNLNNLISFTEENYQNIVTLGNDLLNKKVNAIFINETVLSFIKDEVEDFESKTRVLYTISVKVKIEDTIDDVDVENESFNVYISGIDVYGDIAAVSRSDVNMIMTINPKTNKILLTSIPRDYYVRLHGTTGYKDKLTHSGLYGIDTTVNTIEDLLDININYYIRVNFTTVIKLVDTIGGIDIYSDTAFTAHTNSDCKFIVGTQHVGGDCALAFSRERYAYTSGDRHRVKNQQDVLIAIIGKMTKSSSIITKYTSILNTLGNSFQTNMPQNKIYSLINMQIDKMPNWNIEQISLDGTNSSNYTYSYSASKLYVMEPDVNTIYNAQEKIEEVFNEN